MKVIKGSGKACDIVSAHTAYELKHKPEFWLFWYEDLCGTFLTMALCK